MRTEWDGVLCLQLGPVDRHFAVRITYQGGPFRADIEAIEIRTAQGWIRAPWLEEDRKLRRFLRTKSEVDRAALLAEPKVAATIPGVVIEGGDDAFFVKPLMVGTP
ncbi:host-nuclease inhibitor Gam family protein [Azospirillum sp. A29]|jgi:phage host-nuclease inhibitor protein Gam|uniref:hypothetical protein n=1 Tax=Azospirillum sp. A29 TaxID=3160606 RepID=UPI00366FAD92